MQNNPNNSSQSQPSHPVQVQDNDMNVQSSSQGNNAVATTLHGNNQTNGMTFLPQQLSQQQSQIQQLAASLIASMNQLQQIQVAPQQGQSATGLGNLAAANGMLPPALVANFISAASMGLAAGIGSGLAAPLPLATLGLAAAVAQNGDRGKPVDPHTPKIFLNRRRRSGKWIPEEERYAELLIEWFQTGRIPGCENGSTLRSFLKQKLHCEPMRISKKYAGKGIGKILYMSKEKENMNEDDKENHDKLVKQVEEAQSKFHKAVLPNPDPLTNTMDGLTSSLAHNPMNIAAMYPMRTPAPATAQNTHQTVASTAPSTNPHSSTPTAINPATAANSTSQTQNPPQQTQGSYQGPSLPANPLSFAQSTGGAAAVSKTTQPNSQAAAQVVLNESAKLLRQSFLDAMNQSKANAGASIGSAAKSRGSRNPTCQPQHHGANPAGDATASRTSSTPTHLSSLPDFLKGFDLTASQEELRMSSQNFSQSSSSCRPLDTDGSPDANEQGPSDANPASYDNAPAQSGSQSSTDIPRPIPSALFTADSYAMFAVESAMAASQHDAYLSRASAFPSIGTLKSSRSNSIDKIDGMVRVLSEQVPKRHLPLEEHLHDTSQYVDQMHALNYSQQATTLVGPSIGTKDLESTKVSYVSASERSNQNFETESSSARDSTRESSENAESSTSDGGSSFDSLHGSKRPLQDADLHNKHDRKRPCRVEHMLHGDNSSAYSSDGSDSYSVSVDQ